MKTRLNLWKAGFLSLLVITAFLVGGCDKSPTSTANKSGNQPPAPIQAEAFHGQVYKSFDQRKVLTLISKDECELNEHGTILLCKYTKQNDNLRVVTTALGTSQVLYYRFTNQGLQDNDGNVLFSPEGLLEAQRQAELARQAQQEAQRQAELAMRAKQEARRRLISQATTQAKELGRCRTVVGSEQQACEVIVSDVGFRTTTPWPSVKPDVNFASISDIRQDTYGGKRTPTVVFNFTEYIPNCNGTSWTAFFFDSTERDRCYQIAIQAYSAWKVKFPELVGVGQSGLQSP